MSGRAIALVVGAALVATAAATAIVAPGCTTHQCDAPPYHDLGAADTTTDGLNDPNTWQSNPIDGTWVPYPPQQDLFVFFPLGHRPIEDVTVLLLPRSPDVPFQSPYISGDTFAIASGNIAELTYGVVTAKDDAGTHPIGDGLHVHNNTCADYYARIVITFASAADASTPVDASVDVSQDAPPDAPTDAPTDAGTQ